MLLDRAYDSRKFRDRLAARGIEPIVPYRKRAVSRKYRDGRKLRQDKSRWKLERTVAWLGNLHRVLTRPNREHFVYRGFVHLPCVLISLGRF